MYKIPLFYFEFFMFEKKFSHTLIIYVLYIILLVLVTSLCLASIEYHGMLYSSGSSPTTVYWWQSVDRLVYVSISSIFMGIVAYILYNIVIKKIVRSV
jgi:hypothetical protein